MKKMFLSLMSLVLLFTLAIPVSAAPKVKTEEKYFPTLFIHGYLGDGTTFDKLFNKLNEKYQRKVDAIYTVDGVDWNGVLVKENYLTDNKNNPIIKVIFADNSSSVAVQSYGVRAALKKAVAHYNVSKVNLVGHSMGGLAIADQLSNEENGFKAGNIKAIDNLNLKVNKFVSVDSPFLGSIFSNTKLVSNLKKYFKGLSDQAVSDLDRKKRREFVSRNYKGVFPKNVAVFSVNAVHDPFVEKQSAFGLSVYMDGLKMERKPIYKEINVTDDASVLGEHSAVLHQESFYKELVHFLWE